MAIARYADDYCQQLSTTNLNNKALLAAYCDVGVEIHKRTYDVFDAAIAEFKAAESRVTSYPSFSTDGQYLFFLSAATNLDRSVQYVTTPAVGGTIDNVFVFDTTDDSLELISRGVEGVSAANAAAFPSPVATSVNGPPDRLLHLRDEHDHWQCASRLLVDTCVPGVQQLPCSCRTGSGSSVRECVLTFITCCGGLGHAGQQELRCRPASRL